MSFSCKTLCTHFNTLLTVSHKWKIFEWSSDFLAVLTVGVGCIDTSTVKKELYVFKKTKKTTLLPF